MPCPAGPCHAVPFRQSPSRPERHAARSPAHVRRPAQSQTPTVPLGSTTRSHDSTPHRRAPALWIGAAAVVVLAIVAAFYPGSDRDAVAPAPEGPRVESIAVLPFRSIGDTPDGDLFAEGMTDMLISKWAASARSGPSSHPGP